MARSEAQKRADKKYEEKRAPRKDYWLFEFYPDSAPETMPAPTVPSGSAAFAITEPTS